MTGVEILTVFVTHWRYPIKETEEDKILTSAWTGIKVFYFCLFLSNVNLLYFLCECGLFILKFM